MTDPTPAGGRRPAAAAAAPPVAAATPAELKARRERLGLSTRWLAQRWQVRELTVQRWERDRVMPASVGEELVALEGVFDAQVEALVASGSAVYRVPRTDEFTPDEYPAMWHRAVAIAAAAQTGGRLSFLPELEGGLL